jgi:hypothetical protein
MRVPRATPIVVLLLLAGACVAGAGCSEGTTPVCDDAGSCLILSPSSGGGEDVNAPDTGEQGDAAAE